MLEQEVLNHIAAKCHVANARLIYGDERPAGLRTGDLPVVGFEVADFPRNRLNAYSPRSLCLIRALDHYAYAGTTMNFTSVELAPLPPRPHAHYVRQN